MEKKTKYLNKINVKFLSQSDNCLDNTPKAVYCYTVALFRQVDR